jgi:heme/copper-type cytochrome/quinol oxidase subunit 2
MPKYHTGDEVDIMIYPDDPSVVYVPGDTNTQMFSLVFIVIGSVMIVMGVVVFAVIAAAAKKNRSEERRQEEPWLM